MTINELIARLNELIAQGVNPDMAVLIDSGKALHEIEDVDLDTEDYGVAIWMGRFFHD